MDELKNEPFKVATNSIIKHTNRPENPKTSNHYKSRNILDTQTYNDNNNNNNIVKRQQ